MSLHAAPEPGKNPENPQPEGKEVCYLIDAFSEEILGEYRGPESESPQSALNDATRVAAAHGVYGISTTSGHTGRRRERHPATGL